MIAAPKGTAISVAETPAGALISIPYPRISRLRYLPALFLVCWLCGWLFGEVTVVRQLLTQGFASLSLFLLAWLCAWTIGGALVVLTLVRTFRPAVPETILMEGGGLRLDSGVRPVDSVLDPIWRRNASWSERRETLFPQRRIAAADRRALQTLKLREGDSRNRLTLDVGTRRFDLANAATDIEREWLFALISQRYRLASAG